MGDHHLVLVRRGERRDDLFGPSVNLASRLCAAADPDTVLVSNVVHELGSADGFTFLEAEERELKGFSGRVRVFELRGPASTRRGD
jgi:class 3 adenylate cyclase